MTLFCIWYKFDVTFADASLQHQFSVIPTLMDETISHYRQLLMAGEDRVTELCRLSKETWRKFDVENTKCDEWRQKVERARDEKVSDACNK